MLYPRWFTNPGLDDFSGGLSILDLVNSGTVDCKLAGLLWVLMEQRASLLVASGPSYAGKTTLMHALLDFLPPGLRRVTLQGHFEDFRFTQKGRPERTYMISEEISNHGFYEYLWGYKAIKAFKLLSRGYALGATIHARNSQEVLYLLNAYLTLPLEILGSLGIVVNLRATAGPGYYDEPVRRVSSIDLILPVPEGLAIQVLAARKPTGRGFDYQPEKTLQESLAAKHLLGRVPVKAEIDTRRRYLKHLLARGDTSRRAVRQAVLAYYNSRPDHPCTGCPPGPQP